MTEEKKVKSLTAEQENVVKNKKKKLVVSASAGSGKTFVVVEKLIKLICEEKVPVSRLLVLTFTKAAANELKTRLYTEILNQPSSPFLIEQLDDIMLSDISTIDSFCEKIIKRNINTLSLPQNFAILDEKGSTSLKDNAFKRAFEKFSQSRKDVFNDLYFAFKRNSDAMWQCLQTIQSFLDSDKNGDAIKHDFIENVSTYHDNACQYLKEKIKVLFNESQYTLKEAVTQAEMMGECLAKGHIQFIDNLKSFLSVDFNNDFISLCKNISTKALPSLSTAKCEGEIKEKFVLAKEKASEAVEIAKTFNNISGEMLIDAKNGKLAVAIFEFYDEYIKEYSSLKQRRSALDFADLERYAQVLLQDQQVKLSLQEKYDYIIIDEYQDTNRLQEAILKPIAEKGHFIAVGDIKQGIYGFRNASKEIMSDDIDNFSNSHDGDALFLRGNFRTDERILSFVNSLFEKIMTIQSVGIDYKETSMLEGKNKFLENSLPAVRVDVVLNEKEKTTIESECNEWEELYSVKDDQMQTSYKFLEEITTIACRIEEVLTSQIYSPKTKEFRPVQQGDIALLFRNRSPLMQECVQFLQERGFAVNADIKENLLDDSQIAIIVSLLKLTINENDDIALASVMASPFGNFTLDELAEIREKHPDGSFYEIVIQQQSEKIDALFSMIEELRFNIQVFGIVKALEKLFIEKEFAIFIDTLPDRQIKRVHLNKLFAFIRSNNLEFSTQELISLIENANKDEKVTTDGGNAITITTIHATKGLEYPIVILCGAGENLSKVYNKNFIITNEFALATYLYSFQENERFVSPSFLAGKLAKKKREWIDEIMLFYVALTRAQNHLYIIGSGKEKDFTFNEIEKQNSYLKLIFYAVGKNFTSQLFSQELLENKNSTWSIISEIQKSEIAPEIYSEGFGNQKTAEFDKEINDFYNFEYPNKQFCKLSFKNSVTGASKVSEEYNLGEVLFEEEEKREYAETEGQKFAREKSIEIGNSYHEALKLIDFNCVCDIASLEKEFERKAPFMHEGFAENINHNLLLKNILKIKDIIGDNKAFKEREFIMECSANELDDNMTFEGDDENALIVQGIIDLFAIGEKLILVDYKYTSCKDEEVLKDRYGKQLDLYKKALVKAFGRKVDKSYLLSLKDAKLIDID